MPILALVLAIPAPAAEPAPLVVEVGHGVLLVQPMDFGPAFPEGDPPPPPDASSWLSYGATSVEGRLWLVGLAPKVGTFTIAGTTWPLEVVAPTPGPYDPMSTLRQDVGLSLVIETPEPITWFSIADPRVAHVERFGPYLRVVGVGAGETNLVVEQGPSRDALVYQVAIDPASPVAGTASAAMEQGWLALRVGEAVVLGLAATPTAVGVGDPKLASARLVDDRFVLTCGVAPGRTDLALALPDPGDPQIFDIWVLPPGSPEPVYPDDERVEVKPGATWAVQTPKEATVVSCSDAVEVVRAKGRGAVLRAVRPGIAGIAILPPRGSEEAPRLLHVTVTER